MPVLGVEGEELRRHEAQHGQGLRRSKILFFHTATRMLFGDAKKNVDAILDALRQHDSAAARCLGALALPARTNAPPMGGRCHPGTCFGVAGVVRRAGNVAGSGSLGRASRMRWARRSDDLERRRARIAGARFWVAGERGSHRAIAMCCWLFLRGIVWRGGG